jgi:ElaB/YqjD/DUF883 family membrane-anchored ribosome-binding protein
VVRVFQLPCKASESTLAESQKGVLKMDEDNNQPVRSPYSEATVPGSAGAAARMKEEISDKATDIKAKVSEFGRRAGEKIDDSRESAAGALEQTASSFHSGGNKISGVAHSAADKLQATADYVRRTDLKGMSEDVQDLVKRYPRQALTVAAVLGFLVARGLRGRN